MDVTPDRIEELVRSRRARRDRSIRVCEPTGEPRDFSLGVGSDGAVVLALAPTAAPVVEAATLADEGPSETLPRIDGSGASLTVADLVAFTASRLHSGPRSVHIRTFCGEREVELVGIQADGLGGIIVRGAAHRPEPLDSAEIAAARIKALELAMSVDPSRVEELAARYEHFIALGSFGE